jgi:hypothetical protein
MVSQNSLKNWAEPQTVAGKSTSRWVFENQKSQIKFPPDYLILFKVLKTSFNLHLQNQNSHEFLLDQV